jgi:hypothetical protein
MLPQLSSDQTNRKCVNGRFRNLVSPMGGRVKSSAFGLSSGGGGNNSFALSGGQTIVVQVQPVAASITMDGKKGGDGVMRYAQKEIRIQAGVRNKWR